MKWKMSEVKGYGLKEYKTKGHGLKEHKMKGHGMNRNGTEGLQDIDGLIRFNRELYLKNPDRFVSYVIWLMQFIGGWFAGFMGYGGAMFYGVIVFVGMMFQYRGMTMLYNREYGGEARLMPLQSFFGVRPGILWCSRMVCLLKSSSGYMVLALVQLAAGAAMGKFGGNMLMLLAIFCDYFIVALIAGFMAAVISLKK